MESSRLSTGLVSVTFRTMAIADIVAIATRARLDAIEWGGDVHVPPGNGAAADEARARTADAGLSVSGYGSYYRAGVSPPKRFAEVLETAVRLGAPTIRVWAGDAGSAEIEARSARQVTEDLMRIAELVATAGLSVTLEYHGGTLTDTLASTQRLLDMVGERRVLSGWQPRDGIHTAAGVAEINALRPRLGNVHVFQWWPHAATRHPLADGRERWTAYLAAAAEGGQPRVALLEFVRNEDPEQLLRDADVLHSIMP